MERDRIIETLLLWNLWEHDLDTGIRRDAYQKQITRYLKTDEVVTVTGVRRCGKSTLLRQTISELVKNKVPARNTLYVNFESPQFYNFLNLELLDEIWETYRGYLKPKGKTYLVLDEIQKIRGWEHWVRSKYDRKEPVKIFVTGSNAELLSSEYAGLLTGRHLEISVTPLSFREFLKFRGLEADSDSLWLAKNRRALVSAGDDYLNTGGFPKIVLSEDELLRNELLSQYFDDILAKDIAERHKLKDWRKLKNLALFYGTNFTRKYSFNKVKKFADFPLSLDSIDRFSQYLADAFLVDFLPRFSYSLKNQMQTDRKIYFVDNGMRNAVAFKFSADKGKLLENAVFAHLKRQRREVFYFQEKQEVDFVCKHGSKGTELINVCYSLADKETFLREVSALKEAMRYFKLQTAAIIIAEGEPRTFTEDKLKVSIIPFHRWALEEA